MPGWRARLFAFWPPAYKHRLCPGPVSYTHLDVYKRQILSTVHLTPQNDPIQAWAEHNANFQAKTSWLTDYNFDYLHYTSDRGTDFKAWLIDGGQWLGGSEATLDGVVFNPNMPTEEVFTTPLKGKAEGIPVSYTHLLGWGGLCRSLLLDFPRVTCSEPRIIGPTM